MHTLFGITLKLSVGKGFENLFLSRDLNSTLPPNSISQSASNDAAGKNLKSGTIMKKIAFLILAFIKHYIKFNKPSRCFIFLITGSPSPDIVF